MCYVFKWKINVKIIEEEQISIFLKIKVIELRDIFLKFVYQTATVKEISHK